MFTCSYSFRAFFSFMDPDLDSDSENKSESLIRIRANRIRSTGCMLGASIGFIWSQQDALRML